MTALSILDIQENSFRIQTDNFNSVLSKVGDRPFALISINGATRTGKSYGFNFFVRYLNFITGCGKHTVAQDSESSQSTDMWIQIGNAPKFLAKSGRMRTTLGIDLWSEPFIIKLDGREIAVLLMDCQGLFDEQTTGTQNAIIFSLSSLCSSISVFKLMRNIDESSLQQIQFFSGYAHLVSQEKDKAKNQNSGRKQDEENSFQRLIFLIRDFEFPGYDYGYHRDSRKIQGTTKSNNVSESESESESTSAKDDKNYCVDTFYPPDGDKTIPKSNVFVREEILKNYKDVSCFLMPHPGKQFVRDETKPTDKDFELFMKEFVELVFSPGNLVTKRIGGQEITGNEFKPFVEGWAKLCEKAEDKFPTVQTIAESTATIQNTLALSTATAHYEKAMTSSSFEKNHPRGLSDSEFLQLHEKLQKEAMEIFNNTKKFSGDKLAEEHRQSLAENILRLCESSRQVNLTLVSKAKTNDELEEKKKEVTEVQGKIVNLEVQRRKEEEKHARAMGNLHQQIQNESSTNAAVVRHFQDQIDVIQSTQRQYAQAAENERNILVAQLQAAQARAQESEGRH